MVGRRWSLVGRRSLALSLPLLLAVGVLLGGLLIGAFVLRRHSPQATAAATWAQPESEVERALLAAGDGEEAAERLGEYYLEAGRPAAAVWQFLEARGKRSGLARALQQGRWPGPAERVLKPLLAAAPENKAARRQLAELHLTTGRPREAMRLLLAATGASSVPSAAVSRLPGDLLLAFGRACQATGEMAAARAAYARATKEQPDDPEPPLHLGRLLLATGDEKAAADLFRRTVTRFPDDPRPRDYLGRALMRLGGRENREEAGRCLSDAAALAPAYAPARFQLGLFHEQQGRRREAGHAFLAVLKIDPRNAEAHRRLGGLMDALGEPARAHYHRGWAFVFQDRPHDAVTEFRAMAAADPESIEAPLLISQGVTEMTQDPDDRALTVVKQALARRPRESRLLGRMAALYFLTHDRRAAAALCEEWRRFQPEAAEPLRILGKVAVADHLLDEGIRLLEEAAAKEPARAEIAYELGEALSRRPSPENLRRALDVLGNAVTLDPARPRYRYQLAVVLDRLGEREAARRQLLRVLDQDPASVPAINSLVRVARALGKPGQARFWAEMAAEIEGDARAEEDLRRRLGRQPEDADSEVALARLLIRRGALATAREHLARARDLRPHSAPIRAEWAAVERILAVIEG